MVNVLIVDDHPLVRAGIKNVIQKDADIRLVGEASSGKEAKELALKLNPQLILLDLSLPDCNGASLIPELKAKDSNVKVVVVSMHQENEFVSQAIRSGADGYVLKNSESQEILSAIHSAFNGNRYITPGLDVALGQDTSETSSGAGPRLTDRELEVLQWVVKGLSAKEIAEKLSISHRTVEVHKQNMMHKVGAKNIADLVRLAFKMQVVS